MAFSAELTVVRERMTDQQLFGEIFPIRSESLPPLTAYRIRVSGDESPRRVGSKLIDWLTETMGGCWVLSGGRLITDAGANPVKLMMALDSARAEQPKAFAHLDTLEEDFNWQATPEEIADYVVRGPLAQ